MSYHWFNTEKILTGAKDKYYNNGGKKRLLSIILLTKKF